MAEKKRMGGMSLSSFGQTATPKAEPAATPKAKQETEPKAKKTKTTKAAPKAKRKTKAKEKTATLNIQVTRSQQRWLQDTAQDIRDNNAEPVPGPERVYPVHLIQAAIDLLKTQDVSWDEITDIEGLRDKLNI